MISYRITIPAAIVLTACLALTACANRRKLPALSLENGITAAAAEPGALDLRARLVTGDPQDPEHASAGAPGTLRFELSLAENFSNPVFTEWHIAAPGNDFTITARAKDLRPGARYFCRARFGATARHTYLSEPVTVKIPPSL